MSLGKDSIQKRVAAAAAAQKKPAAKKAPAKKAAPKTAVVANISPETVEKVIARKESDAIVKISLGEALPPHLL